jgi:hypothetical protein
MSRGPFTGDGVMTRLTVPWVVPSYSRSARTIPTACSFSLGV